MSRGLAAGVAILGLVAAVAVAQPAPDGADSAVPLTPPPPPLAIPPVGGSPDAAVSAADTAETETHKPTAPSGPPLPVRSPVAILQVLDKVTAETFRFAAPVGRRMRYRSLVFTVKACETRDVGEADPKPSAYLVIESRAGLVSGATPLVGRQVYSGWMFANSPGLHPFQHPVYDAWLVTCSAQAPST